MARLTDKCKLTVARVTLEDETTVEVLNKVERGICVHVTDNIIPASKKKTIINLVTDDDTAALLIRTSLMDSIDPDKMTKFITALEKKQPDHAKQLSAVYQEKLEKHRCEHCLELPDVPDGEPGAKSDKKSDGKSDDNPDEHVGESGKSDEKPDGKSDHNSDDWKNMFN